MEDYAILDLHWNRQTVRDSKGNISEIFRGIDYDLDWILMGECFAKFKNIILKYDNLCFEKLKKTIDFDTFDLVASNDNGTHYFKDKSKVYFKYYNKEYVLEGANPDNFKVLDIELGISTDTLRYYYYEKIIPFDLSKATIINEFYTISNDKVFICFEQIEGADAGSFTIIRENLGKDKNHVYFKGQIVLGADAETFMILEDCVDCEYYEQMNYVFYAKDKSLAYYIDATAKAVKPIKSKSLNEFRFEIIDEKGFCFDKEYRYYFGKRSKIV